VRNPFHIIILNRCRENGKSPYEIDYVFAERVLLLTLLMMCKNTTNSLNRPQVYVILSMYINTNQYCVHLSETW